MSRRTFLLSSLIAFSRPAWGAWKLPSYDDVPPEASGLAVASVGRDWPRNPRVWVGFRPIESPDTIGELVMSPKMLFSGSPIDIENGELRVTVATRRLIPGRYEIYGATVMEYMGMQVYYSDKRKFSFPFEIVAGKATYLGEFIGFPVRGEDALGMHPIKGSVFCVRDQMTRDLELLQKRGIVIPEESVIRSVMTKEQSANSIFKRLD